MATPKKKPVKKAAPKKKKAGVKAKPGDKRIGNKFAIGNNGGRPALYNTAEELTAACDEYFEYIKGEFHMEKVRMKNEKTGKTELMDVKVWDRRPEPATITGLVLYLGFTHRCSLDDYEKRQEFSDIIKRARLRVEYAYELRLEDDKPTGAIFALKQMKWVDKTEVTNTNLNLNTNLPDMTQFPDEALMQIGEMFKKYGSAAGESL